MWESIVYILNAIFGGIGRIFTRAVSPADATLFEHYRIELERMRKEIAECLKSCDECEKDRQRLWAENARHMEIIKLGQNQLLTGVIEFCDEGKILYANPAVAAFSGYTLGELQKLNVIDLIDYRQRDNVLHSAGEIIGGSPLPTSSFNLDLLTKAGTIVPMEIRLSSWTPPSSTERRYAADISWR